MTSLNPNGDKECPVRLCVNAPSSARRKPFVEQLSQLLCLLTLSNSCANCPDAEMLLRTIRTIVLHRYVKSLSAMGSMIANWKQNATKTAFCRTNVSAWGNVIQSSRHAPSCRPPHLYCGQLGRALRRTARRSVPATMPGICGSDSKRHGT